MIRLRTGRTRPSADSDVVRAREVPDAVGPEAVDGHARMLAVGAQVACTLVVTGYPAEVASGWLAPLLNFPGHLDIALHVDPVPSAVAAAGLKKQRARLESTRRAGFDKRRLDDPEVEAAAADAADLAYRIARGEGKLFHFALYLTVYACDEQSLAEQAASVRAVAESLLLSVAPATYRALPGWLATLPLGIDTLKIPRTFDTTALAACFPFTSPDLPLPRAASEGAPTGVFYGLNTASGAPVLWDRFAQDNYNSITLARSGAGKSYLTKLELLRLLFTGVTASVIDPEDEYVRLAETVGGQVIALGADGVCVNPFGLPATATEDDDDALTRRVLFLHSFLAVLFGTELSAADKAVLDRALLAAYAHVGITADRRTWQRTPPTLTDLATVLREDGSSVASDLADRLQPYTAGSHARLFNGHTTTPSAGHLTVFALRHLPDEVKAPAMLLALDAIWRRVTRAGRSGRHLAVVDEAWLLRRRGRPPLGPTPSDLQVCEMMSYRLRVPTTR